MPSPVQDCPGHWEDPRAPTSFLPPDPLELSNVGTVVHRLQAAFQEALDLYHLVSQAPGSGERKCVSNREVKNQPKGYSQHQRKQRGWAEPAWVTPS